MRGWLAAVAVAASMAVAGPAAAAPGPLFDPGQDVDYQLGGVRDDLPDDVGIVVRDRKAAPLAGRYNVCYVNGFQTQPDERRFWREHHWRLVLKDDGRPVVDSAWGEWVLDIRTREKRRALARIVGGWTDRCADDGFDAVEYDNLDSFSRSHRLVTRRHAKAFARLLVGRAHDAGLPVGQKNWAEWDGSTIGFDFAVAEECGRWRECRRYAASYGDHVLAIEYRRRDFRRTCTGYGERWPVVLRDLALTPRGVHRWC
ncbi:endo alpha-1,4 polygalactosaminidase [Nocardioides bizhenqiangii]|uniref:Endo alpha-1,4 polygalactosaminidase n=1 Tax=Nocardioides bizhenqiangii TaxID=3095076 RepID=A0ABZ0ZP87_9ACTN|nr:MULTISPECIES: endo alpha-1,4 polygalactosaminidase [unclassified Nocardioides]MDZ5619969.1 endo alpha-1,4 polygalactosaminidase [Nocardioides sp. HM23]WQQ26028.1 endo alpha-1,4 polygalactosaminidase [Nocardioides sp. HM61]